MLIDSSNFYRGKEIPLGIIAQGGCVTLSASYHTIHTDVTAFSALFLMCRSSSLSLNVVTAF